MTRTYRFDRRTGNRWARDGAPWHVDMEPWWWRNRRQTRPKRYHNRRLCRLVCARVEVESLPWPLGSRRPHPWFW